MLAATDYPFMDIFWSMLIFFVWVLWIWMMVMILMDVFGRHDVGGWSKAGWAFFLIILPFLGAFIYLIAEGKGMAERRAKDVQGQKTEFDTYVKSVAAAGGSAAEIEKAKALLDSGAITQAEFDALKAKALA